MEGPNVQLIRKCTFELVGVYLINAKVAKVHAADLASEFLRCLILIRKICCACVHKCK